MEASYSHRYRHYLTTRRNVIYSRKTSRGILLENVHDGLVFREDTITRLNSLKISGIVSTTNETKVNHCITY